MNPGLGIRAWVELRNHARDGVSRLRGSDNRALNVVKVIRRHQQARGFGFPRVFGGAAWCYKGQVLGSGVLQRRHSTYLTLPVPLPVGLEPGCEILYLHTLTLCHFDRK